MITRRTWMTGVAAASLARTAAATEAQPALVELFTSQGCSSCPPADATLARLATRPDVVVLSFHVDYWDNLGWKDPFAARSFTQRQRDYARAFGNRSVYTPQMVFDGTLEDAVQSEAKADAMLRRLRTRPTDAPRIELTRAGDSVAIVLSGRWAGAELWAAAAQPNASTTVVRGENAGQRLANVNIVRRLERLPPAAVLTWSQAPSDQRVAVWLQDAGLGAVRAVAAI